MASPRSWGSDPVEPAGSRGRIDYGVDRAGADHSAQEGPVADGQIGPVKDPVGHSDLAGEREDSIAGGSSCREGNARRRHEHEVVGIAISIGGEAQRGDTVKLHYGRRSQAII